MRLKIKRKKRFIETVTAISHDTDTDFGADTLSSTEISGSGSGAVVQLDINTTPGNSAKTPPGAASQTGSGGDWYDDYGVTGVSRTRDSNNSTFSQCTSGGWSKYIHHSTWGFTLPTTNTVVVGVKLDVLCSGDGTAGDTIEATVTAGGVSNTKTTTLAASATTKTFGGSSDMWTNLPTTPSSYNSNGVTTDIRVNAVSDYGNVYEATLTVYYETYSGLTGTLTSPEIPVPSGVINGWHQLIVTDTKPTNTTLVYDILKASDDSVLLNDQTPPVDLSSLDKINIKIRAEFATTNKNNNPSLDNYLVTAKRVWMVG